MNRAASTKPSRTFAAVVATPLAAVRTRILVLVASTIAIAVPFLAVHHPPIADLPQQVAQLRLFAEAWTNPDSLYRIQWSTPNRLSYLLLGAGWLSFGPAHAGRVAMLAIGLLWTLAAYALARARGRPVEGVALASLVFFNHTTYWGFYSFSCGLPAFALFVHVADRTREARKGDGARLLGAALLLFLSHALWFAAGLAWLVGSTLASRGPRAALARLGAVWPVIAWAAAWNAALGGRTFAGAAWGDVARRLRPYTLLDAIFGGLHGWAELVLGLVLLAWLLSAPLRRALRRAAPPPGGDATDPARRWDRTLLGAAGFFLLAALSLPDSTWGTMHFAMRWTPIATFFAVLAAPALPRARRTAAVAACLVALGYGAWTAAAWRRFERVELSGLDESLAALPDAPRVLGLDLVQDSEVVKGRPFLQTFANAQVLRGGQLVFSFAEFPSSLVVFRSWPVDPWTRNLPWDPEKVERTDVEQFDRILVNAKDDAEHAAIAGELGLVEVTHEGRWRLYRVAWLPGKGA